jgi:hypothetical protein
MRHIFDPRFALAFIAVLLIGSASIGATEITVSTTSDFQAGAFGNAGSFFLSANSQQFQSLNPFSPAIGPNATQTLTTLLGGVGGTGTIFNPGPPIIVSTGVIGQNQAQMLYGEPAKMSPRTVAFAPTISTGKLNKASLSRIGDNVTLTSTSGMYSAQAAAYNATPNGELYASTSVDGTPPPTGQAAARAIDPFSVSPGTYAYDPTITASADMTSPDVVGGFDAFAVDGSTFTTDTLDNFTADGSPLNDTLWYFSFDAELDGGVPTYFLDFQLNPLALNEIQFDPSFIASLGPFSDPTSEALLIDQALDTFIASEVEPDGSTLSLDDASLFPENTTFTPVDGGVDYSNGVDSVVISTPEPSSLAIFATGLLGLRKLVRQRSSAGSTADRA